ncbi:hypothetical protein DFJ73DRAFT_785500 [Zopfochytrium polystomum]|nr:hypothetical protein DFJ73DRAFT_785500 [Zopfochytrium polystomum]
MTTPSPTVVVARAEDGGAKDDDQNSNKPIRWVQYVTALGGLHARRLTARRQSTNTIATAGGSQANWDSVTHTILMGVHLSRTSPLRHGYWPGLAAIDFPPPLIRSKSWQKRWPLRYRSSSKVYDFNRDFSLDGIDHWAAFCAAAEWDRLERWAVDEGLFVQPATESSTGESPAAEAPPESGDEQTSSNRIHEHTRKRRQQLLATLRDVIEPFHVNMLPIVMGVDRSVPDKCKRYCQIINRCLQHCPWKASKVGYLTIQEGFVDVGKPQRSPGPPIWSILQGGVFHTSFIPNACRVWDCIVQDPTPIGILGGVERLRDALDSVSEVPAPHAARNGEVLAANTITCMTSRTPHEFFSASGANTIAPGDRVFIQYFRLVTSHVTVWYEAHSTRNRERGVVPPKDVRIVKEQWVGFDWRRRS